MDACLRMSKLSSKHLGITAGDDNTGRVQTRDE